MNEIFQFLRDNPVFYIATVDGETPKLRPFGFVMEYDGKLCFCTNNTKNVYRQLRANPRFEICDVTKTGEWLRLAAKAVFITSRASKQAALDFMPSLAGMYSADDAIFEIFCADECEAVINGKNGASKTVRL
jgi:uncharacterized pyridoxamine 5'-phosphate oxidase family protein